MLYLLLIILVVILLLNNKVETFQYIREGNKFRPVEFIPFAKDDVLLTLPSAHTNDCQYLCLQTPSCTAMNYYLNDCTLYRNLDISKIYKRYN